MEPFELEPKYGFVPITGRRPRMDEPLPVKLVAVDDVRLLSPSGIDAELDAFYVGLWQFQRDIDEAGLVYRADNFRLRFAIMPEGQVERDSLRPQGIEVTSLAEAEEKLIEEEMEYIRQRGLTPGQQSLLVLDPAGNWIEIFECRPIG